MSRTGSYISNTEVGNLVLQLFVFYIFYGYKGTLVPVVVTLKSTNFIIYMDAYIHKKSIRMANGHIIKIVTKECWN